MEIATARVEYRPYDHDFLVRVYLGPEGRPVYAVSADTAAAVRKALDLWYVHPSRVNATPPAG
jgi:hypothetical protein